ncbi:RNase adapter RapZ [Nocardioidaceae bacterium]|nr:RNase adapter RapZ [Nocardioidaceae bacterium]
MAEDDDASDPTLCRPGTGPAPAGDPGSLVVVTGMTGAGRSTAAKALEDLGYYVVDNLPSELVGAVVSLVDKSSGPTLPVGVVLDVRSGVFFESHLDELAQDVSGRDTTLVFLDADTDVLVRRQEAARRPHPMQGRGRLLDGIEAERNLLASVRGVADVVVDTSSINVHQLASKMADLFGSDRATRLRITVVSFGFKYGIPVDADLVADMRFLPNPYWVPALRPFNGRSEAVSEYVLERPEAQTFLDQYVEVVRTVGRGYLRENKRYMTLAVGCTGGKHRSVAMAEEMALRLRGTGMDAVAVHRDLGRE